MLAEVLVHFANAALPILVYVTLARGRWLLLQIRVVLTAGGSTALVLKVKVV